MSNFRGGFDLDGVLALTQQHLFSELQKQGKLLTREFKEVRRWAMEDNFPGEITARDVIDIFQSPRFWEEIVPCPFLITGARGVVEHGVELHIVTARSENQYVKEMGTITRWWLWYHGIPYKHLAFVSAANKHEYCLEKRLNFFIEDRVDTAMRIAQTHKTTSYLVLAPYNEGPANRPWMFPEIRAMSRQHYQDLYQIHYRD